MKELANKENIVTQCLLNCGIWLCIVFVCGCTNAALRVSEEKNHLELNKSNVQRPDSEKVLDVHINRLISNVPETNQRVFVEAVEEHFWFLLRQSLYLVEVLLFEGDDEIGLTLKQEVLSEKVEMLIVNFLIFLENEITTFGNAGIRAWSSLRWGQSLANFRCLTLEAQMSSRTSFQFPRGQGERWKQFQARSSQTQKRRRFQTWIDSLEYARHQRVSPWSEVAHDWLIMNEAADDRMFTICFEKVTDLRFASIIETSARQTACDAGYEWSCDWLEEVQTIEEYQTGSHDAGE